MTAPVAQLDRVPDYESDGRGSESLLAHQVFKGLENFSRPFFCSPVALRSWLEIPCSIWEFFYLDFSQLALLHDRGGAPPAFHISSVF